MIRFLLVLFLFNIEFPSTRATDNLAFSQLEQYEGVKYLTYTRTNKNNAVDIREVNFDDGNASVFVIHGFEEKSLDKSRKVKNDLFRFNLNVERIIIVSWLEYSRGSATNIYLKVAVQHVPSLAQDMYEKIVHIRENGGYGAIELVGYSIGAHIAGQTGKLLKNAGYTLDQIIGLDPAGDYFSEYSDSALQNGDAIKVVVLHTNINNYGFGSQIGPNDKIVHGGEKQPNCKINVDKCSHYAAWNAFSLYEESLLRKNYETDGVVQTYKPVTPFGSSIPAEITLSGREEVVQFTIDDTSGEDAIFTIVSHDLYKFDVKLTSPSGNQFSSSSPEYFSDNLAKKGFRISHAEHGQWNLTIVKYYKRRLSRSPISFTANSRQVDASGIVLNADVSHRILEYPKPITVMAELKFTEFPIIYAEVFADIVAPRQTIRLPLYDNGIYPDEIANDGIYTNDIVRLPKPERYSISVTAQSNGTAMSPPKEVNFLLKDAIDCKRREQNCTKMVKFVREAEAGSIKLVSNSGLDKIPPQPVSDLRGEITNFDDKIVSLEWTSPRNELFDIQIKRYDIRVLVRGTDFENGLEGDVVRGSLDAMNSGDKNEKISLRIPKNIWDFVMRENLNEFKFALKSIGYNDEISEVSNIASVAIVEEGVYLDIIEYDLEPAKRVCETINSNQGDYSVTVLFC